MILVNSNDRYKRKRFEKKFDKLIILYRDPFDTLRSAYTMKHPGHSESVDSEIFNVRGKCFGTDIVVVVICILLNVNIRENRKIVEYKLQGKSKGQERICTSQKRMSTLCAMHRRETKNTTQKM